MVSKKIICDGCGQERRWEGVTCLDSCPCLSEPSEISESETPDLLSFHALLQLPLYHPDFIIRARVTEALKAHDKVQYDTICELQVEIKRLEAERNNIRKMWANQQKEIFNLQTENERLQRKADKWDAIEDNAKLTSGMQWKK
ncbi:MAG TPA: hypothetical protein ENI27_06455 [bacterium]|nr:hypothetical protein [bacterium]